MRAVDTNVLVRLLARDDAPQVARAEQFVAKGAWVSLLVLLETAWVLSSAYALDSQALALAVEMLLNHKDLVLQDADVVARALEQFRDSSGVGFSDCLILQAARKSGNIPLGSFDKSLARLPDSLLL